MRESITVNGRVRVDVKREGGRKRKKSRTGKKRVDNKLDKGYWLLRAPNSCFEILNVPRVTYEYVSFSVLSSIFLFCFRLDPDYVYANSGLFRKTNAFPAESSQQ